MSPASTRARRTRGFVYAELLLTITVVGSALVGLLGALAAGFGQVDLAERLAVSGRLTQEAYLLIEQEALEATRLRDDQTYAPPLLASGSASSQFSAYLQRIEADWISDPDTPDVTQTTPTDFLRVTVEVLGERGPLHSLTWVRARR